ncbi:Phosphorylated carbohydrates phosphatase [Rubrobacter xylanophilus DSM 9941]|uniref:HAD family hydrolase n=1 Tax=Rubrobacter xylanophilus TaxID=49319 RepID=UPI001C643665|nr:HAD family hydrolase [Rubrobacter xylanophilus]QYJ16399.1 Phosphorylated carbohydrates phosphatase [Rubrobacter xylanophilus DSM 9941]
MARAVVLDVDGTLMDTNYLHVEAWARAFDRVGCRVPRARVHRQIGKGSDRLVPEFISDDGAAAEADRLHGEIFMGMQEYALPLPGAKELIASLSERGCDVWFVTSAKPEELEKYLELLETEGRLSGVVNSADVENSKPAPDIFELALERAGFSPEETVAVGDAIWDVQAAHAAGIRTVAVLTGGAFSARELEEAGAAGVYEDCEALLRAGFPW